MGGMWGATWQTIFILTPVVLICFLLIERRAWDLNTLSSGDDVARNLGINVDRFRITGLLIVSFAASALMGALILLVSDTVARVILAPVEIPVGVIMYVLGGIFFLFLITRGHGRYLS